MAKVGFWLQGANGKVAGTTIYQADGETVMRVIKKSIKNPKTKAQLIQRIITKTVMKQYSAMKAICDHSFEGYTAGAKCMARFGTLNNNRTRELIAKAQANGSSFDEIFNFIPLKSAKFVPASVMVSEGTLPRINAVAANSEMGELPNITANTYQAVLNALGLERGDQLTFITVEGENDNFFFSFVRVILDPREEDGTPAPLTTPFVGENNTIVKPSFRNEGKFQEIRYMEQGTKISFCLKLPAVAACAVIASRKVGNDWLRSTEVLSVYLDAYLDDKISLQKALELSMQSAEIYTDSERYLNNAGVGGPQENA